MTEFLSIGLNRCRIARQEIATVWGEICWPFANFNKNTITWRCFTVPRNNDEKNETTKTESAESKTALCFVEGLFSGTECYDRQYVDLIELDVRASQLSTFSI